MRKLTMFSLLTIIIAVAIYGYYYKPAWLSFIPAFKKETLTKQEIEAKDKLCKQRFEEVKKITDNIRKNGQQVTDPRLFYSPELGDCLATYLLRDPKLPDPKTYNSYVIYNVDRGKDLYSKAKNMLATYQEYLKKIDELDK